MTHRPQVKPEDYNPSASANHEPSGVREFGAPTAQDRERHRRIGRGTIRLTHAEEVYVRTGPSKLVTGTLERGDRFEVISTKRDGRWAWGHAGGQAARAGWVYLGNPTRSMFTQIDRTPNRNPGPARDTTGLHRPYVTGREKQRDGTPYTRRARVINPNAKLYGNYQPGRGPASVQPANFRANSGVGMRYSPYPGWVVVFRGASRRENGHVQWGLMRRSDLEVQPHPAYQRWQRKHGVTNTEMWGRGPVRHAQG